MVEITLRSHDWVEFEHEGNRFEMPLNCDEHHNQECYIEELEKIKRMSFEDIQNSYDVEEVTA